MIASARLWWKKIKQHPIVMLLNSRLQQIKHHPFAAIVLPILGALALTILIGGYRLNWAWTGFTGTTETYKTLYDWLQLLFIPVALTGFGFFLNYRERKAAERHADKERQEEERRTDNERDIEEKRAKAERDIAEDNQREAALQAYINGMSELLLEKKLRESTLTDEVRTIARVRTLTVLPRLDAKRKRNLLLFLYDAGLVDRKHQIIDISDADLSEADLGGVILCRDKWIIDNSLNEMSITTVKANLSGVDLRNANLNGANLNGIKLGAENETELIIELFSTNGTNIASLCGAKLVNAKLCGADLGGVDLRGADLSQANLGGAYLMLADLSEANLHGADMSAEAMKEASFSPYEEEPPDTSGWIGADLSHADFRGADLSEANLSKANLGGANLQGANMTDANLTDADLSDANLTDAIVTTEQLNKVKSLRFATLRDGSKQP